MVSMKVFRSYVNLCNDNRPGKGKDNGSQAGSRTSYPEEDIAKSSKSHGLLSAGRDA